MPWWYWILAFVAAVLAVGLLVFAADLLVQEWKVRQEERQRREREELVRRLAYVPLHYLNEDQDTRELPAGAVQAAVQAALAQRAEVSA